MTITQTYTGQRIDLMDPSPHAINITDIAHHLAQLCRFNGATKTHYSVAQHSVLVAAMVPEKLALPALLHDAHEAYTGDITSPVKAAILQMAGVDLSPLYALLDAAIGERFGTDPVAMKAADVKAADRRALATERRDLMVPDMADIWARHISGAPPHPDRIKPLPAADAEALFLRTFRELAG